MRCVIRYNDRPIAETEAVRLSSLALKISRILRCSSSVVEIVKSIQSLSAGLGEDHDVSFLAALMVYIV